MAKNVLWMEAPGPVSFEMDGSHAEPRGYLAGTQSPDGMIHLVSSRNHYRFNLPWLVKRYRVFILSDKFDCELITVVWLDISVEVFVQNHSQLFSESNDLFFVRKVIKVI